MLGDTYDTSDAATWFLSVYLYPPWISVGVGNRHRGSINVLFYDGHGQWYSRTELNSLVDIYKYDPP
jgi:prepilin-type processing-associated H-X9-DG protein